MAQYRIIKEEYAPQPYLVQKRFLGFLWWYDPFEDGFLLSDGYCDTLEAAKQLIWIHKRKRGNRTVVWEE